jgi:hypothetical protein
MKTCRIIFTCLSVILILSSARIYAQNTRITWYSFNMGYSEPNTDNTMIKSVVGQSFIGTTRYSDTQITSGFLADTLFRWMVVGVPDQEGLPTSYSLGQNYPNPFNPSTTIQFDVPKTSIVTLKVYNMLGQEVATLVDEKREAGKYEVVLNGSEMSSGVYFYRLQARTIDGVRVNDYVNTKKLLLVK